MKRKIITLLLLCGSILLTLQAESLYAQNELNRISIAERSDGKGYVVRNHLSSMVDSVKIEQPSPDRIQMLLFAQELDTLNFRYPPQTGTFNHFDLFPVDNGMGVEISLSAGNYFKTRTYPDQNGRDLLLAMERVSSTEIEQIAANSTEIDFTDYIADIHGFAEDEEIDNSFLRIRDNQEFNVIVLDAGHGGKDPGTENRSMRLQEKDIALAVTLKVGEYIKEHIPDVEVVYTRTDDTFVPLSERGLTATRNKGDLFVSIHVNAAPNSPSAHGTETFFLGLARSKSALEVMKRENSVVDLENGPGSLELSEEELLVYELTNTGNLAISERIASMVEDQFKNRAQRRSRGVKQAGLEALWHASTPAVLIELGFLSNPSEARFLNSDYGQTIMASAIFRAIRDFKLEYDRSIRGNGERQASNE
ncbi:N-acetylmuramoyl-L-alanine amidase family protein [Rhodohalobacter halophilus]|uniref:N-acetylmuramoyl-L-alanine amidase family protein n=1 Tax=Rhodohalobacter halophilus TaxID=1812810 RepID=UPI000AB11E36|nr:N-acetylmuramoyl-L-alanine amidase [Rhodohalobacter halophilus]